MRSILRPSRGSASCMRLCQQASQQLPLPVPLSPIPSIFPSSSSLLFIPSRPIGGRFSTPSPLAPKEAPPVVFKPPRPSFNPLSPHPQPFDPEAAKAALQTYWPDGFIPSLITPLPWIRTEQPTFTPSTFTQSSVRCAALGRKIGMMAIWDKHGVRHPITVIEIDTQVVRLNPTLSKGKVGLVVGLGRKKLKKVNKPMMVQYKQAGVFPKQHLTEFRVTPDALLPIGLRLDARHFLAGQFVDVAGITQGKGFQGAMRRHGFGGQPASHGVSVSHRSLGSTGSIQDPGRVWKNKKMAGRMGGVRDTQLNLLVYKVEPKRNLLFLRGHVPGNVGGVVEVRDAIKKSWEKEGKVPPFPSFQSKKEEEDKKEEQVMDVGDQDPFAYGGT